MGIETRENYEYDFKKEFENLNKEVLKWSKENKNDIPELTYDEVKKFSENDIKALYKLVKNENELFKASKEDKKWRYLKYKGKKIYLKDMAFMNPQSWNYKYNGLFLHITQYDWAEIQQWMVIGTKKWNKIEWIYIWEETKDKVYKWELKFDTYWPIPAKK